MSPTPWGSPLFRRGDFQEISAVPLLKGYLISNIKPTCFCVPGSVFPEYQPWMSNSLNMCPARGTQLGYQTFTCKTTTNCSEDYYMCEPVYAFGRVHVGTAQSGEYVWFAGGLQVTGDGPQGNVISYDYQSDPQKRRPALRPMHVVKILNVVNGRWLSGQVSSARFGVAGAGGNRFVFFAGGAQLTQDGNNVVNELQWQVNTSSCETLINSNVVEFFDMQECFRPARLSTANLRLRCRQRVALQQMLAFPCSTLFSVPEE